MSDLKDTNPELHYEIEHRMFQIQKEINRHLEANRKARVETLANEDLIRQKRSLYLGYGDLLSMRRIVVSGGDLDGAELCVDPGASEYHSVNEYKPGIFEHVKYVPDPYNRDAPWQMCTVKR